MKSIKRLAVGEIAFEMIGKGHIDRNVSCRLKVIGVTWRTNEKPDLERCDM